MTPQVISELQRMHARWSRMARDTHRTYRDYPGHRTEAQRVIELQKIAWAFAYAARVGMDITEAA